jgi:hypothetical protein
MVSRVRFGRVMRGGVHGRRILAAAAVALFFASGLANLHHFQPLTHAVCSEHGKLVHIQPAAFSAGSATRSAYTTAVESAGAAATMRGHDHCPMAAAAHARATAQPHPHIAPAPCAPVAATFVSEQALRPAVIPPYRVAPKQSPPA